MLEILTNSRNKECRYVKVISETCNKFHDDIR